jgi:hypothetical protein
MAYGVNPMIPHPDDRPRCITCEVKPKQITGKLYKDGSPRYRSECSGCYRAKVAKKHGVIDFTDVLAKNAGFASGKEYTKHVQRQAALNAGFDTVADWKNSKHPYRKYRKDYCENLDGRLGFSCTTTILINDQLEVDHINGKPWDNRPKNLQTLCGCCHTYKTRIFKDYATPGRKSKEALHRKAG